MEAKEQTTILRRFANMLDQARFPRLRVLEIQQCRSLHEYCLWVDFLLAKDSSTEDGYEGLELKVKMQELEVVVLSSQVDGVNDVYRQVIYEEEGLKCWAVRDAFHALGLELKKMCSLLRKVSETDLG